MKRSSRTRTPEEWHEQLARAKAKARADERMKVGTEANAIIRQKDERIADLLEDLAVARAAERERIAADIEEVRSLAWQTHLREHPLSGRDSCPRDYGMYDAYGEAARIARTGGGDD